MPFLHAFLSSQQPYNLKYDWAIQTALTFSCDVNDTPDKMNGGENDEKICLTNAIGDQ